tara:strand:+ start:371 stop:1267 length:897 start_codon:yes stop_codon:yes gene_type:complete
MKIKYDNHEQEWEDCLHKEERIKIAKTWLNKNTLGVWRMHRMLGIIKPFITSKKSWVTIGDGRYGSDANYIIENGGQALATDISDTLLKIGHENGYINLFSEENAENLSFEDESFDYVLIKEAFHHFPRPWIGLYEAFRVCKKAVILIEPNDTNTSFKEKLLTSLKNFLKSILRYKKVFHDGYWFEDVGNFGYTISKRELEKFLLGMHFQHIAFHDVNDHYIAGVEFCPIKGGTLKNRIMQGKIKRTIFMHDLLSKFKIIKPGMLGAVLYKSPPDQKEINEIKKAGWRYKKLPVNPYL